MLAPITRIRKEELKLMSVPSNARRPQPPLHFCEILLEGLAPDGGLYLPAHYPQVDEVDAFVSGAPSYQDQGYAALAFEVLSLYIDDIPARRPEVRSVDKTYTEAVFRHQRTSCR